MLSPLMMPEAYLLSASTIVEETPSLEDLSAAAAVQARLGAQALQDSLHKAGISSQALIKAVELCYWTGRWHEPQSPYPVVQVSDPGASSLQAVFCAGRAIAAGDANIVIAGGCGQTALRAQASALAKQLGMAVYLESQMTPVSAAVAFIFVSTQVVGVYNFSPIARLAARSQIHIGRQPLSDAIQKAAGLALRRTEIELTDLDLVACDDTPHGFRMAVQAALDCEGRMAASRLPVDAGETQGAGLMSRLLDLLVQGGLRFGMLIQPTWNGALLAALLERV
jgi:hypothetical protein